MDPNLLLGALLIGVGLALAALAYSLITERTSNTADKKADPQSEDKSGQETDEAALHIEENIPEAGDEEPSEDESLPSPHGVEDSVDETIQRLPELKEEESLPQSEDQQVEVEAVSTQDGPADKPEPPEVRPTFPVATLMRDEVSGDLVIRVGDKSYRSKQELEASKDWSRVRFAADDLAKWIVGEPTGEKVDRPAAPRRPSAVKPDRSRESETPRSMVEEIDGILQELLVDSPHADRAVRLLEGSGGMARVLIGIDSYSIEDVPDEEIQRLIKQAVAQWEATR